MINKNQITYFLGAGASYHAIPTIDGLSGRINNLIKYLAEKKETAESNNSSALLNDDILKNIEVLKNIITELDWLNSESEHHQTVDTLAKKFYVQQDIVSLCRLKKALMIYFFFEQNIVFPNYSAEKNKHDILLDKRYDNLIASIAERAKAGVKFKNHIKFITWNYDLQIDLAIKNYFPSKHDALNRIKNDNNIHPNQKSYSKGANDLLNNFATIKLNGNAFLDDAFKDNGQNGITVNDYRFQHKEANEDDILGRFLFDYNKIFQNGNSCNHEVYKYFNFAWETIEKYPGQSVLLDEAIKIMEATKVLIIVGYSFPYFNSEIDKQLFANCNPNQIIIQDLVSEQIKDRVLQLLSENKVPYDHKKIKTISPGKYFPIHPET